MKPSKLAILLLVAILFGFLTHPSFSQLQADDIGHEGDPNDLTRKIMSEDIPKIKQGNLPHVSQTLSLLEKAFTEHQVTYLDKISSANFQRSAGYKKLQGYLKGQKINFNHISETATQGFLSRSGELVVVFDKAPDNKWYIADAYLVDREGQRIDLGEQGFSPLEYEGNFEGLITAIGMRTIEDYYGLAPRGKLGRDFIRNNKLELSQNKTLKIKNIIIHDGNNKIEDFISLTLRYYPPGSSQGPYENQIYKSGWLIEESGAMSELYRPGEDVYMDYLLDRNQGQLNLNAPNKGLGVGDLSRDRSRHSQLEVPKQNIPTLGANGITGIKCKKPSEAQFEVAIEFVDPSVARKALLMLQNKETLVRDQKIVLKASRDFFAAYLDQQNCESLQIKPLGDQLEIDFSRVGFRVSSFEKTVQNNSLIFWLK